VVVEAHRFEVPNCYRHLRHLQVRYAGWDLTQVHLLDERTGQVLCRLFPQDKARNATGIRRPLEPIAGRAQTSANTPITVDPQAAALRAPLLSKYLAQQAATGLPPPYLCLPDDPDRNTQPDEEGDPV